MEIDKHDSVLHSSSANPIGFAEDNGPKLSHKNLMLKRRRDEE